MSVFVKHHEYQTLGDNTVISGQSDFHLLSYKQRKLHVARRLVQMLGLKPEQINWSNISFAPDREDAILAEFPNTNSKVST